MELKDYQKIVLNDLDAYLELLLEHKGNMAQAFKIYWQQRGVANQHYKNNVVGVPHVCVKVPTAGGKTFIATNALSNIFSAFEQHNPARSKFVMWLVPSDPILEQTIKHLSNPDHPYRQQLNLLFNGRVQVYEKDDVLLGAGFSVETVREQLSIVVMIYDSLKGTSKAVLRAFKDNGYLASFLQVADNDDLLLPEYDKSALINVIRTLKPVIIVDESHNAESPLSVEMLQNLNPSFILDLTATPRNNSNIISYVDAMQLKKRHMVKLPVIVANQQCQDDVIMAALKMRAQLEEYAKQEEVDGGEYIRPIVLFQAEPKNNDDTTTFDKVKQTLLDLNIPEDQIKIKTAKVNDLKGIDLMSRKCPVRYIITVNALKEGWDCPFAYVLANLANKSSVIDVTQILGRILRMPHVRKHKIDYLNLSYVFTASTQFQQTLSSVVAGLNKAGFSERDYRQIDVTLIADSPILPTQSDFNLSAPINTEIQVIEDAIDNARLNSNWESEALIELQDDTLNSDINATQFKGGSVNLSAIKAQAMSANQAYENQANNSEHNECPPELEGDMNIHKMKPNYTESAKSIVLPQFFQKVPIGGFFESEEWQILSRNNLLNGMELSKCDSNVSFEEVDAEVYEVDLKDIGGGDSSVDFSSSDKTKKNKLNNIIRSQSNETQTQSIVQRLFGLIGKKTFEPIDDNDVKKYLMRIVESMSQEQRTECLDKDYIYIKKIKDKINTMSDYYAEIKFDEWLTTGKLNLQLKFKFGSTISPSENAPAIAKSLYVKEGKVNSLELPVIKGISDLPNIKWWHRNLEKGKGFVINGFINHYPDFIILTDKDNIIIVETKGDDRDNSDSKSKVKLGAIWANYANRLSHETGFKYHYMMIFDNNPIEGSYRISEALKIIKQL